MRSKRDYGRTSRCGVKYSFSATAATDKKSTRALCPQPRGSPRVAGKETGSIAWRLKSETTTEALSPGSRTDRIRVVFAVCDQGGVRKLPWITTYSETFRPDNRGNRT